MTHVEPWQTGTTRVPSTAFCLLMKFFLMRLTTKQMKGLLNTGDCSHVRAIGFLYLRYTCPPKDLYGWFEPYLEDPEEFHPSSDTSITLTIGAYLINLLTDMHYYNTTLPRIPVPIERRIKVMLLLLGEKQERRIGNQRDEEKGKFCRGAKVSQPVVWSSLSGDTTICTMDTVVGFYGNGVLCWLCHVCVAQVLAIYSDEENEPAWYEAVVDSRDREGEEAVIGGGHRYWVTFTAYGNTESVDIGDMKLQREGDRGGSRSRSRDRDTEQGRGGGREADGGDLLTKVLNKERQVSWQVILCD